MEPTHINLEVALQNGDIYSYTSEARWDEIGKVTSARCRKLDGTECDIPTSGDIVDICRSYPNCRAISATLALDRGATVYRDITGTGTASGGDRRDGVTTEVALADVAKAFCYRRGRSLFRVVGGVIRSTEISPVLGSCNSLIKLIINTPNFKVLELLHAAVPPNNGPGIVQRYSMGGDIVHLFTRCDKVLEIVEGPSIRYRQAASGESATEVFAIGRCPACALKAHGSAHVALPAAADPFASGTLRVSSPLKFSLDFSSTPEEVMTVPLDQNIQANPFVQFPLLHWAKNIFKRKLGSPFEGLHLVFVLHYLTDLLPFTIACCELGLASKQATFFYKSRYKYPYADSIRDWLEGRGFETRPVEEVEKYLEERERGWMAGNLPLLIVEDGGYLVPELHRRQSRLLEHVIGAVEQTTKGLRRTEDWGKEKSTDADLSDLLRFPLISIPDSTIKTRIEPPLIGNEVVQCIQNLTTFSLKGARVALLGLGRN